MSYLLLFVRGFVMVGLVSWQTRALQRGDVFKIMLGAFLIGIVWYGNVLAAVEQVPFGWLAYATGSSIGAYSGWRMG